MSEEVFYEIVTERRGQVGSVTVFVNAEEARALVAKLVGDAAVEWVTVERREVVFEGEPADLDAGLIR